MNSNSALDDSDSSVGKSEFVTFLGDEFMSEHNTEHHEVLL
jgi:hypothetical protein